MNRKIKILFTIPNFVTAGSQFVLLAIYNNLDQNIFDPKVLVEKHPETFPKEIKKEEQLFLPQFKKASTRIKKLSQLLKKEKIDIVHSWDYKSTSVEAIACRVASVKYIYTKKNNAWSKRWFAKSVLSSYIAYDNPEMKERFFTSYLLNNKVSFIPHGVDTKLFIPLEKKTVQNQFIIGCIGVLGENKNQLFLLKALTKLPSAVKMEFYGKSDKDYFEKLNNYIKDHNLKDRVTFKGFIENITIPEVLSSFTILVLASNNEGLPVTLLEAMACGIPVLSSDSGGGARYILTNNTGGFIYKNKEDFINKVTQLIKDEQLLTSLSKSGRQRVITTFSIEKEVSAYESLYKKLFT